MDDKTKLLRSLAIERTATPAGPAARRGPVLAVVSAVALVAVVAALWFVNSDGPAKPQPAQPPNDQP